MKTLKLIALETSNVVATSDGDFNVSHGSARQIVGKTYDAATKSWKVVQGGVEVACVNNLSLNYYISRMKEKALLPGDAATAALAGLSFPTEQPTRK
jgi:hypothetical protein